MALLKCCNPFKNVAHGQDWMSSVNVLPVSSDFLEEYGEFFPRNCVSGDLFCSSCKLKVENSAKMHPFCCNPFDRQPHRIREFRPVTLALQEQFEVLKHKLPLDQHICDKCRIQLHKYMAELKSPKPLLCANPFMLAKHNLGKNWRKISSDMLEQLSCKNPSLKPESLVCGSCRLKFIRKRKSEGQATDEPSSSKRQNVETVGMTDFMETSDISDIPQDICDVESDSDIENSSMDSVSSQEHPSSDSDSDFDCGNDVEIDRARNELNSIFAILNMSPYTSGDNLDEMYSQLKMECKTRMNIISKRKLHYTPTLCRQCDNLLEAAKTKFKNGDRRQKYTILTTLSSCYSKTKIQNTLGCGKYIVQKAAKLRDIEGPFSYPLYERKASIKIDDELKRKVLDFYTHPNYSRTIPGERNSIRVKFADKKADRVQKQQLLLTLDELYKEFIKENFPNTKPALSISTFYLLKPQECVWMGNKLYQRTCCCIIHENFTLLLAVFNISIDLKWILENVPCDTEAEKCMYGFCSLCPKKFGNIFADLKDVSHVTFYQWKSTDGVEMLEITESVKSFKTRLRAAIPSILKHHFLVRQQNKFIDIWKTVIFSKPNEAMVKVDFAMNYSFVFQNEVQSSHWYRKQATVHPFFVNFWCPKTKALSFRTYIAMSDHLKHDTICFYALQSEFLKLLKKDLPFLTKLVYVSDGSAAQYKNRKNVINLLHHENDFGLKADWEFFPTAHGKSECDAASGVVKRTMAQESKRRDITQSQLVSHLDLLKFCRENLQTDTRTFFYVSNDTIQETTKQQEDRFSLTRTIKGTRDFHSFHVISKTEFEARHYSLQDHGTVLGFGQKVTKINANINDFVAVKFGMDFNIGIIISISDDEIIGQFYKKLKTGQIFSFSWPSNSVEHAFLPSAILRIVQEPIPTTQTRRAFKLQEEDLQIILAELK